MALMIKATAGWSFAIAKAAQAVGARGLAKGLREAGWDLDKMAHEMEEATRGVDAIEDPLKTAQANLKGLADKLDLGGLAATNMAEATGEAAKEIVLGHQQMIDSSGKVVEMGSHAAKQVAEYEARKAKAARDMADAFQEAGDESSTAMQKFQASVIKNADQIGAALHDLEEDFGTASEGIIDNLQKVTTANELNAAIDNFLSNQRQENMEEEFETHRRTTDKTLADIDRGNAETIKRRADRDKKLAEMAKDASDLAVEVAKAQEAATVAAAEAAAAAVESAAKTAAKTAETRAAMIPDIDISKSIDPDKWTKREESRKGIDMFDIDRQFGKDFTFADWLTDQPGLERAMEHTEETTASGARASASAVISQASISHAAVTAMNKGEDPFEAILEQVARGEASRQAVLDKMAGGGISRGGLALVGERGPEIVSLPGGARVHPSGTGPGTNNFIFHGAVYGLEDLRRVVVEAVRDHALSGGFRGVFGEA
jgi:hypothetical protein